MLQTRSNLSFCHFFSLCLFKSIDRDCHSPKSLPHVLCSVPLFSLTQNTRCIAHVFLSLDAQPNTQISQRLQYIMLQLKSYLKHDYFYSMFCSLPPLGSNLVLDNPCVSLLVHMNTDYPPKYPKDSISPCTRMPKSPSYQYMSLLFLPLKKSGQTADPTTDDRSSL